ncbi:LURP-one-related/scramblase family protein [Leptolyngbya iicbica]|uniref:Uncharacterized protein n=2 Tax=Cyanophyceae TaxID=3028117 RepID=A0A4Q7EL32_9CYAN|nr:LURP-one-related family protein [Leptolyngbya sp. LK]RZM82519.1 hypothetical protein DYY88_04570 [Leptolyngbya sp. LK]
MKIKQLATALGVAALTCAVGTMAQAGNALVPIREPLAAEPTVAQARVEPVRYRMTDRWLSLTDSYIIRDADGEPVFTINGRLISLNGQMVFRDVEGRELARIQNKIFDIIDTIQITRDREVVAEVRPAIISPLRQSYIIDVPGVGQGVARGDFVNHEYEIRGRDSDRILATVTRRFLSVSNAYDIEIMPLRRDQRIEDDVLFIATAAAIDLLESTDAPTESPVAEPPPVESPDNTFRDPLVVNCLGTVAGSNIDFSTLYSPEGGFARINFGRDGATTATAELTFDGRNAENQMVWRGAVNGMADVTLTHLSDQMIQVGDRVAVLYDGQEGLGTCQEYQP